MDNVEIPDAAVWYVRTAIDRGYRRTRENVQNLKKWIDKFEDSEDEMVREMVESSRGMLSYEQQWLREAEKAFLTLPASVRPTGLFED